MKKTILLSSLFAVGAAFAGEVTNANAVAALDFAVTTAAAQTLVAVPFEGFEEGGKVKVNDIVKTSDLGDGSKLYVPNAEGKYDTWTLTEGEWEADVQVEIGTAGTPVEKVGVNSTDVSVDRGDAFWIQPTAAGTIYLLGQGTDPGTSTAVKNCWNLIGNASIAKKTIGLDTIKGKDGDQIVVQVDGLLRYYTYTTDNGWRYKEKGKWKSDSLVIKAGQGFWYKYASTEENTKTIQW